jgi:hypothetical protein
MPATKRLMPAHVPLEGGVQLECYSWSQLLSLNRQTRQARVQRVQSLVGADRLPPLLPSANAEIVARWVVDLQVAIGNAAGMMLTPADFGAPKAESSAPSPLTINEVFRLQQFGIHETANPTEPVPVDTRSTPAPAPFPYPQPAEAHNPHARLPTPTSRMQFQSTLGSGAQIHADATAAADDNKRKHRGTLDSFLFGSGEGDLQPPTAYVVNPPYQIAPHHHRPNTNGTTYSHSYKQPPSASYHQAAADFDF